MDYPEHHYDIVNALFREGRFLLEGEAAFHILHERADFYRAFFQHSFHLDLQLEADYAFLRDEREEDAFSRAVCLFLAVLCHELDRQGGEVGLSERLTGELFSISRVEEWLTVSSFRHILLASKPLSSPAKRANFYKRLDRRGIIERAGADGFRFTVAERYFRGFAIGIGGLKEEE